MEGNSICNAAFYESAALRASACSPSGELSRSDKRGSVASPQAMTEGVIISSAAFCESAALRGKLLPGASGRNPLGGSRQSRQALTEGVSSSSTIRS